MDMPTGLIFNIQKYSLHDGPGIRTTVFLKGCPLECWWCHNPESHSTQPDLMVFASRCVQCGACRDVCPQRELRPERVLPPLDQAHCLHCGECAAACPTGARQWVGRRLTVAQTLAEILQDRIFYDESGGGVTLSGGEPLLQLLFVKELLAACRAEGIHTALDTCGFARREDLLLIAPLTDLFLYDVKLMDDRLHRQYTGVSNTPILENLQVLSTVHDNIWIRVPIIPGVNDQAANLAATAKFVAALRGVHQVTLLPFHGHGVHKAERLGRSSRLDVRTPPSTEQMETMADYFRAVGLQTGIGAIS
jgi:pyruvate formate lyase activating enzyme